MRRPRRRVPVKMVAAAVAAFALAITVVGGQSIAGAATGSTAPETKPVKPTASDLVFPRPGGGPRAIHAYHDVFAWSGTTYLLHRVTGEYRKLPFESLVLSPDERTVAVEGQDGRIGIAQREALLNSEAAVRWTNLPLGSPSWWSPDGTALLVTTLDKEARRFTAHRYDVATGQIRSTPISLDCDTCTAGWAADSTRYVVRLRGPDPELPDGPMQYLNPDGTPGPLVGANGHIWNADSYSPSRRYVVVEPSRPLFGEPGDWQLPKVFDLLTGTVVSTIRTDWPVVGWYDDGRVVRVAEGAAGDPVTLEVLDIHTGEVTRRVPAPGFAPCCFQLGSAAKLRGEASELGF